MPHHSAPIPGSRPILRNNVAAPPVDGIWEPGACNVHFTMGIFVMIIWVCEKEERSGETGVFCCELHAYGVMLI